MIARRHERSGPVRARARYFRGVSRDRERTVTRQRPGRLDGEEKARPMDILMPLCVCVFAMSRSIADSNQSRGGTAAVWKCGLGQGHGVSRR